VPFEVFTGLLGIAGAVILVVLPGCWFAFGIPISGLSFSLRLACGVLLSPMVVFAQFCLLRWVDTAFERIALILPLFNLPACLLLARAKRPSFPSPKAVLAWSIAAAFPATFLGRWMLDPQVRAIWGHSWFHTDIAYVITQGAIRPEDPQLAGLRLGYPWGTEVFHSLLSFLVDRAPNWTYFWVDLVWLACTFVLLAAIVREFGGNFWAETSAVVLLCFAVNFVGYNVAHLVPQLARLPIWGDRRYTPWVRKFGAFESAAVGIGLIAGLAMLATRPWEERDNKSLAALAAVLMVALAFAYPNLFPVGCLLVGGRLAVGVIKKLRKTDAGPFREVYGPLIVLLLGCGAAAIWVQIVAVDRFGTAVQLNSFRQMLVRAIASGVVLSPLWFGLLMSGRALFRRKPEAVFILLLSLLGCLSAHALAFVYYPANEYKFILPAAMFLVPFAAIFSADVAARTGRFALPLFLAVGVLLMGPLMKSMTPPEYIGGTPQVDVSRFSLSLAPSERYAALTETVRVTTPIDSVLITGPVVRDLVAVTKRSLFVPYEGRQNTAGIGMQADIFLKLVLGYDPQLIDRRRQAVHDLYEMDNDVVRNDRLNAIKSEVKRPIVIVLDEKDHVGLHDWLSKRPDCVLVHRGNGVAGWLVR